MSKKKRKEITDGDLSSWSQQPYGVGFQQVRQLAAELLEARNREKLLNDLVTAIDVHGACGAIQEKREAL